MTQLRHGFFHCCYCFADLSISAPLVSKREMGLVEKKEVLQVVTVLQLRPCVLSPATTGGSMGRKVVTRKLK